MSDMTASLVEQQLNHLRLPEKDIHDVMTVREISGCKREYLALAVDAHTADPALGLTGHDDHSALHIPGALSVVELNVHRAARPVGKPSRVGAWLPMRMPSGGMMMAIRISQTEGVVT